MSEELYKEMAQSIIDGDSDIAAELAQKSIELQMHPLEAITKGFVIGVNYIGDQFGKGEAFLPELVMAGEAMKAAIAVLEPELRKARSRPAKCWDVWCWQPSKATSTRSARRWSARC